MSLSIGKMTKFTPAFWEKYTILRWGKYKNTGRQSGIKPLCRPVRRSLIPKPGGRAAERLDND